MHECVWWGTWESPKERAFSMQSVECQREPAGPGSVVSEVGKRVKSTHQTLSPGVFLSRWAWDL